MSCPTCGSNEVVLKREAWDALAQILPEVVGQLDEGAAISLIARDVARFCGQAAPKEAACVPVPVGLMNKLRREFGLSDL